VDIAAIQAAVAARIGAQRYQLWFAPHTRFRFDDTGLIVGVPNLHFQEWLSGTFGEAVTAAVTSVVGVAVPVRFVIDPELFQAARAAQESATSGASGERQPSVSGASGGREPSVSGASGGRQPSVSGASGGREPLVSEAREQPPETKPSGRRQPPGAGATPTPQRPPQNPGTHAPGSPQEEALPRPSSAPRSAPTRRWRSLNDFVVGPCNRVAWAAAQAAVEEPDLGVNPLVIYGPVGTGKTHLLEGIYAGWRQDHPGWRVVYMTAEDFTNRFVQAMRHGRGAAFRQQVRECDAFLLDDLQFLANKKATQEEFLHTFDALIADGRPVVLSADCHPRLADDLLPELSDRLLAGGVWGLSPPDADTRLGILRARSGHAAQPIPDEVLAFLAAHLRGNVRELEGALHSVRHYARVTGRRIDLSLAREALGDLLRHAVRVVRIEDVDRAVCQALSLPKGILQGPSRAWAVAHPRMLAVALCRKHTAASYGDIARHFGGKSHSGAVAAEKKVRQWLTEDTSLNLGGRAWRVRDLLERIERDLHRGS
jgi:chromosomal replication initiator protein